MDDFDNNFIIEENVINNNSSFQFSSYDIFHEHQTLNSFIPSYFLSPIPSRLEMGSIYLDSFIDSSFKDEEKYGSMTIKTIKNLMSKGLIRVGYISDTIFTKITQLFFKSMTPDLQATTQINRYRIKRNNVKIKKIISCLPTLREIKKWTSSSVPKCLNEVLFVKISLDLLETYYRNLEYPIFKVSKKSLLNTILKFYLTRSEEQLNFIYEKLNPDLFKDYEITRFKTIEEYTEHYYCKKNQLYLISEGLEMKHFVN